MRGSKYAVEFDLESVQGRLYFARVARGLTRTAVGKAYGSPKATVKNWERGEAGTKSVPYEFVQFAAVAYGVPMDWLLGETHEAPLPAPQRPGEDVMQGLAEYPARIMQRRLREAEWKRSAPARPASSARTDHRSAPR